LELLLSSTIVGSNLHYTVFNDYKSYSYSM